jgi:hypothetical protein
MPSPFTPILRQEKSAQYNLSLQGVVGEEGNSLINSDGAGQGEGETVLVDAGARGEDWD